MKKSNNIKVYAIITLYNPGLDDLENIKVISSQVDKVLIMDNSDKNIDFIEDYFQNIENIHYEKMEINLGLGAINKGINLAKQEKATHVILFDQDSRPENNMVQRLIYDLEKSRKIFNKEVAAIGPLMINKKTGKPFKSNRLFFRKKEHKSSDLVKLNQLPTSGMLIPLNIFFKIGYFCSNLFLDVVDFEWCWRAKKKGFEIIQSKKATLEHSLGEGTRKFLFFEFNVPSPFRHYFLFRNSIFVIFCSYAPVYMRFRYLVLSILKFFLFPLILDNRRDRLKYSVKGILDGLKTWILGSKKCT